MADSQNVSQKACKYGEKCYRKNPDHLKQFYHPDKSEATQKNPTDFRSKRKSSEELQDETEVKRQRPRCESDTEKDNPVEPTADRTSNDDEDGTDVLANEEEVEDDAPSSPTDVRDNIRQKFLVDMPDDFYSFWDFCKSVRASQPQDAFSLINLKLVGPYDVLSGDLKTKNIKKPSAFLTHCRYFFDPPEFQTVLAVDDPETQYHIGYFRDSPEEPPVFLAENSASIDCLIQPIGDNIFAAVNSFLSKKLADKNDDLSALKQLQNALHVWSKKGGFSLEQKSAKMKARDRKVVTKSFHRAGIVVPLDKKSEVGYRPLPETDDSLRILLKRIVASKTEEQRDKHFDSLQNIITLVQFATDECDYGMGLELSMDLFCFGDSQFHGTVRNIMPLAYELLQRPQFAQIVRAHLASRTENLLIPKT